VSVVLAVDGGNSKTDVARLSGDGALLGFARGPQASPDHLGLGASVAVLAELVERAGGPADVAVVLLAGLDFPDEEEAYLAAIEPLDWARRTVVGNDTFAVLRAGTDRGWGVAVTCGAGINCVGVAPDGRRVRFPSLGPTSGDWGGGVDVGLAAQYAAARSEDGRGPRTVLERLVPGHFGLATPTDVARAILRGDLSERGLVELAPLVLRAADEDDVAAAIVDRLAGEVVALARAALTRLDLLSSNAEVVLGGGMLQSGDERLLGGIERGLAEMGPRLVPVPSRSPAVVGSALLGLDELAAPAAAADRARRELTDACLDAAAPRTASV
jgi:N-acetylglucosamine kinase-like BadF-type ATPase